MQVGDRARNEKEVPMPTRTPRVLWANARKDQAGPVLTALQAREKSGSGRPVVQVSAGGPRPKGRPRTTTGRVDGTLASSSAVRSGPPGTAANPGSKTKPGVRQASQCWPGSPSSESNWPAAPGRFLTLQSPPNFPVRTSCASDNTGVSSAENSATKLSHTAKRANAERDEAEVDTGKL